MRGSLCFTVFSCLIGVVFGQYVPVCDPAYYTDPPSIPVPVLPAQFSVVVEANFGQDSRTTDIKEYVDGVGNRGRFEISSTNCWTNPIVGIFDYSDGQIFVIPDGNTGDACAVKPIADPSTRPFLPQTPSFGFQDVNGTIQIGTVSRFFQLLRNTNATWLGVEVVRGIPCNRWQTCTAMQSNSYTLDYYFATENWDFALGNGPIPVQVVLNSVDARAESLTHTYTFVFYDTGPSSVPNELFTVPIGLVCTGRNPDRPIPPFPQYFSLSLEAVQQRRQAVVVYKVSLLVQ